MRENDQVYSLIDGIWRCVQLREVRIPATICIKHVYAHIKYNSLILQRDADTRPTDILSRPQAKHSNLIAFVSCLCLHSIISVIIIIWDFTIHQDCCSDPSLAFITGRRDCRFLCSMSLRKVRWGMWSWIFRLLMQWWRMWRGWYRVGSDLYKWWWFIH